MTGDAPNYVYYADCLSVLTALVIDVLVYQTVFLVVIVYQPISLWYIHGLCVGAAVWFFSLDLRVVQSWIRLWFCMLHFCYHIFYNTVKTPDSRHTTNSRQNPESKMWQSF